MCGGTASEGTPGNGVEGGPSCLCAAMPVEMCTWGIFEPALAAESLPRVTPDPTTLITSGFENEGVPYVSRSSAVGVTIPCAAEKAQEEARAGTVFDLAERADTVVVSAPRARRTPPPTHHHSIANSTHGRWI